MFSALEAISFNANPKLGKDLENFFQKIIDYRDKYYPSPAATDTVKRQLIINDVCKKFISSVQELTSIIAKDTGFQLTKIIVMGGLEYPVTGFFGIATYPRWINEWQFQDVHSRMTGTQGVDSKNYEKTAEELGKLAKGIDKPTGIANGKYRKEFKDLRIELYFDMNYAFLRDFFLPEQNALTAAELTAIILHELGHMTTFTEHFGDQFCTQLGGRDTIRDALLNAKTPRQLHDTIKKVDAIVERINKANPDGHLPIIAQIYGNARDFLLSKLSSTDLEDDENSYIQVFVWFVSTVILSCLWILIVAVSWYTSPIIFLSHELSKIDYAADRGGKKISDTTTSSSNMFKIERWADEFATRQGYGAELATGLNKLVSDFEKYINLTQGNCNSNVVRNSSLFTVYCTAFSYVLNILSPTSNLDPVIYEDIYNRIKRIRENILGVFKNTDMSADLRNFYLRQLDTLEEQMENNKKFRHTEVGKALRNVANNLLNPARWATMLADGNMHKDFELLANQVDAMSNNELYSIAARLKR